MKQLSFIGLLSIACTFFAFAQGVPPSMSYQGYVTNLTGSPVADGAYKFTFSLYQSEVTGTAVWTEIHPAVQVSKGLFTVQLGRGTPAAPLALPFDQQYFLGIQIGADPELAPRVRLGTSAYSFRAKMADNVPPGLIGDTHVSPTAAIAASKLDPAILTESEIVAGNGVTIDRAGGQLTINASSGAVTLNGDVTGPAAMNTIADNAVTAAKIAPNVVSSIGGVSNDGGDIALVAGSNVTITPDDAANTITIAASGGGGGLTLPYIGAVSSADQAFSVAQQGMGRGGNFQISNTASQTSALQVSTNSNIPASNAINAIAADGHAMQAWNNSAMSPTISATNSGSGPVALFGNMATSTGDIVSITKNGGTGRGLNISYAGTTNAVYIDNNSTGTGLELRQDGTGKAAYFHIESTTSTENALLVESKSTSSSSDAVQASAASGRAFYGTSAGGTPTVQLINSGTGRAINAYNNSATNPAIVALNSTGTANAKIFSAQSTSGEVFAIDKEGDATADGAVTATSHVATATQSGTPVVGGVYKNNVTHAWARVGSNGALGESFGISGVTRTGTGAYTVNLMNSFPSMNALCATVTAFFSSGPRFAMVAGYAAGSVSVETYNSAGVLIDTSFSIIVVGQP